MQTLERQAAIILLDEVATRLTAAGVVDTAMDQLIFGLQHLRAGWPQAEWQHFATVIAREHPLCWLIHEDPFTRRAFEKPRGYPGDAALLDYIYDGVTASAALPRSTSDLGRSLFSYTTATQTCRAILARRDLVTQTVDMVASNVRNPRILAVAAGHLREAQQSHAFHNGAIGEWIALDQDAESLKVTRQSDATGTTIHTVTVSIQELLRKRLTLGTFDLIYAAGLYDYLVQPIARRLTRHLFDMLRPGGRLLIGNVVPSMQGAAYMEAYMDWWLIYRNAQDMHDLAALIPPGAIDSSRIFEEEYKNIAFLELTKMGSQYRAQHQWQHHVARYVPHEMQLS